MTGKLEIVEANPDLAVGVWESVLLCQFRRATPASGAATLRSGMRLLARRPGAAFFPVIEPASTPPDDEARRAYARFLRDQGGTLAAMVATYRGEGFRGAVVRGVISSIDLLVRLPYPRHIAGSLDEAAILASRYAPGIDAAELLRAFRLLSEASGAGDTAPP